VDISRDIPRYPDPGYSISVDPCQYVLIAGKGKSADYIILLPLTIRIGQNFLLAALYILLHNFSSEQLVELWKASRVQLISSIIQVSKETLRLTMLSAKVTHSDDSNWESWLNACTLHFSALPISGTEILSSHGYGMWVWARQAKILCKQPNGELKNYLLKVSPPSPVRRDLFDMPRSPLAIAIG
jgi:hypothetical protein